MPVGQPVLVDGEQAYWISIYENRPMDEVGVQTNRQVNREKSYAQGDGERAWTGKAENRLMDR